MSESNGKLIRELIDLGSSVSGYRVNGSDKAEIKIGTFFRTNSGPVTS